MSVSVCVCVCVCASEDVVLPHVCFLLYWEQLHLFLLQDGMHLAIIGPSRVSGGMGELSRATRKRTTYDQQEYKSLAGTEHECEASGPHHVIPGVGKRGNRFTT